MVLSPRLSTGDKIFRVRIGSGVISATNRFLSAEVRFREAATGPPQYQRSKSRTFVGERDKNN